MKKISKSSFYTLLFVLFLDGLGQGILFPILTETLTDPTSTALISWGTLATRKFLYGLIIALFGFFAFLGSPILGDLSDHIGRKVTLILAIIGTALSFFLSGIAFLLHNLTLLLIGRAIDGFTVGTQSIAQAAIVDECDPKSKAEYLGYIFFAFAVGVIFGPLIGGLVAFFGPQVPLYIAGSLGLINVLCLYLFFKGTHPPVAKEKQGFIHSIAMIFRVFTKKTLGLLVFAFFLLQGGFNTFYIYASEFLKLKYSYGPGLIALYIALMGIGLALGFAVLVRRFEGRSSPLITSLLGYLVLMLVMFITVSTAKHLLIWALIIPGLAGFAVGYSFFVTTLSNQVGPSHQGWILGTGTGITFLAIGIMSLLSGPLAAINVNLPIYIACAEILVGLLLALFLKPHLKEQTSPPASVK